VCCGLVEVSKNAAITFPIKKRINTELFIDKSADLYIQNRKPNFLAKLKKVICWRQDQQEVGIKTKTAAFLK